MEVVDTLERDTVDLNVNGNDDVSDNGNDDTMLPYLIALPVLAVVLTAIGITTAVRARKWKTAWLDATKSANGIKVELDGILATVEVKPPIPE